MSRLHATDQNGDQGQYAELSNQDVVFIDNSMRSQASLGVRLHASGAKQAQKFKHPTTKNRRRRANWRMSIVPCATLYAFSAVRPSTYAFASIAFGECLRRETQDYRAREVALFFEIPPRSATR